MSILIKRSDMDTPKIEITSQYQSFTSMIDWVEIYNHFEESKLSCYSFYQKVFPSLIKEIFPSGYMPSISTLRLHFRKIKKEGVDGYLQTSRGLANYKKWNEIYDEQLRSGLNMRDFFEKKIRGNIKCGRSAFYRKMDKIKNERARIMKIDDNEKSVNIVTLKQEQFEQSKKTPQAPVISTSSASKMVTVSVNLANKTSITFESSNPEQSVAQIIAALGKV